MLSNSRGFKFAGDWTVWVREPALLVELEMLYTAFSGHAIEEGTR